MAHRGWKRDGFTPAKKAKAIEALGKYGNVADACRVAGVSDTTFYRHLNKDPDFARLCELNGGGASAGPDEVESPVPRRRPGSSGTGGATGSRPSPGNNST